MFSNLFVQLQSELECGVKMKDILFAAISWAMNTHFLGGECYFNCNNSFIASFILLCWILFMGLECRWSERISESYTHFPLGPQSVDNFLWAFFGTDQRKKTTKHVSKTRFNVDWHAKKVDVVVTQRRTGDCLSSLFKKNKSWISVMGTL